jgi:ribosomal protein L37E
MPISDDDPVVPPIVDALVENVKKLGPMVMEVWECKRCEAENFCFHHFIETLTCENCGFPTASNVKRYLSIREQRVDGQ